MTRGSVWWVDFEPAQGGEIQKVRPAVIVSNDISNHFLNRVVVVPLTSNTEKVFPGTALVQTTSKTAKALADQIRTVDKSRLKNKLCELSDADMRKINSIIKTHLGL